MQNSKKVAASVFGLVTLAIYLPILQGRIPFPRDLVLQFSPWVDFVPSHSWQQFANIGDLVTVFYPFRSIAGKAVQQGVLPLWNPYFLGGAPFLARAESALFYPLTTIYYVLPLWMAWTMAAFFRTFLAAFFTWLFMKSIGASEAGAIFAGMVYACCGWMTAWQGYAMSDAAIWLPLILYGIHRLRRDLSFENTVIIACSFAMPVLAGHPETAIHVVLVGVLWALALWAASFAGCPAFDNRFVSRIALSGILAFGLASVQIFPTVEWVGFLGDRLSAVWEPLHAAQALGWVSRDVLRHPNSAGIAIPEASAYAGMISLLLAPLAVFHPRRRIVWFFAIVLLVGFGIAYGFGPWRSIAEHTPLLRTLKNSRLIFVMDFAVAVLAGIGLSALEEGSQLLRARKRLGVIAVFAAAFLLSLFLVYMLQRATVFRVEMIRRPSFSRTLLFLGAAPIVAWIFGLIRGKVFSLAVCLVAAFDLITFSFGSIGFARPSEIFPKAPVFEFLKQRDNPFRYRVAQMNEAYPPNAGIMYDLASADGYEISLQRALNFSQDYSLQPADGLSFVADTFFRQNDRRMDMLNVRDFVVATRDVSFTEFLKRPDHYTAVYNDGRLAVFENKRVLPRAFIVPASGIEIIQGMPGQMSRIKDPSFDPQHNVVLSSRPSGISAGQRVQPQQIQTGIEIVGAGIHGYTFHTSAAEGGILILSQIYYPGWRAFVDDHETAVFDADYALTGLAIPSGEHEVHFVFQPLSFRIGFALSCISMILIAGIWVRTVTAR